MNTHSIWQGEMVQCKVYVNEISSLCNVDRYKLHPNHVNDYDVWCEISWSEFISIRQHAHTDNAQAYLIYKAHLRNMRAKYEYDDSFMTM